MSYVMHLDPEHECAFENGECVRCFGACEHDEHDHGICLDCETDITNDLVAAAEYAFEGDR